MAKFCTACGKAIPEGVAFCTECGTRAPADAPTEVKQENKTLPNDERRTVMTEEAPKEQTEVKQETVPPPQQTQQQPPQRVEAQAQPRAQPQPQYTQPAPQQPAYQNQQPNYQSHQPYTQPAYQQQPQPTYQQPVYHQPQPTYHQPPPQPYAASPAQADDSGGVVGTGTFFGTMFLFGIPIIGFLACIIMCFAPKKKSLKNYAKANLIWAIIGLVISILLVVGLIAIGNSILDYINEAINGGLGNMSGAQ